MLCKLALQINTRFESNTNNFYKTVSEIKHQGSAGFLWFDYLPREILVTSVAY